MTDTEMPGTEQAPIELVIYADDFGMCHAVNQAVEKAHREGLVRNTAAMVPCPWFTEAVEVAQRNPDLSVGVHLTLTSEWTRYKWGPVSPREQVPHLVNEHGHFFAERSEFAEVAHYLDEIACEARAQIQRALSCGLDVAYLDSHMVETEEMAELFRSLAAEYGIPRRMEGVKAITELYTKPIEQKRTLVLDGLRSIGPGRHSLCVHPGLDVPEMQALEPPPSGTPQVAARRQAETDLLCDPEILQVVEERGIRLLSMRKMRDAMRAS